jgi:hypothetical protein
MEINEIVRELDGLISRLVQARGVLTGLPGLNVINPKRGRPAGSISASKVANSQPTKPRSKPVAVRSLSREARARIAAAQKARWAKRKKEAAAAQSTVTTPATAGSVSPKKAPAKKSIPTKKS